MLRSARLLPIALVVLSASPALADEPVQPKPAFTAGDRFLYERDIIDLTKATKRSGKVVWEALESTETGHRFRLSETIEGTTTETNWIFNRANNPLAQELGNGCANVNEPDGGRYQWPMDSTSTWNTRFRSFERCEGRAEDKPLVECEVMAKVVAQGMYEGLDKPWPAIAIERVVLCKLPANPGYVSVRFEKELLCPTLGVRCVFEADTVVLPPDVATDKMLAAYRSNAEGQYYTNRTYDKLKGVELAP